MICESCGKETNRVRYDKQTRQWGCPFCVSSAPIPSPTYLHQSAGNKWAPKLTVAKNNVFTRSVQLKSGEVIDRATGKEAAY